jgi:hypothetical protein
MAIGTWFATAFDVPATYRELPAEVTSGQDPTVHIVDQVTRGTGIIGRITGDFGAVALRLRSSGQPVRVSVGLHLDATATWWWGDRVKPDPGVAERPRLVLVRSQGRLRTAAVLARAQGWLRAGGGRATVGFDLAADDLDEDGLLVIELADPAPVLPEWAASRLSASAPIGLRIDRIEVRPIPPGTPPLSAVRPGDARCPFVVLDAGGPAQRLPDAGGPTGRRVRLEVTTAPPAPPVPRSPSNRWTRQKPARAAAKVLRTLRRGTGRGAAEVLPAVHPDLNRLVPRAVDLVTGAERPVQVVRHDGDQLDLRVAGPSDGPVLIGLHDPRGGRRERISRQLACRLTAILE